MLLLSTQYGQSMQYLVSLVSEEQIKQSKQNEQGRQSEQNEQNGQNESKGYESSQKGGSVDKSVEEKNTKTMANEINEKIFGKKDVSQEKVAELTGTLQRLQAEFENYQKRSHRQNNEFREFANASLMEQLLPVLDTLEQGVKHSKEFVLVNEQLYLALKKNGLEKIVVSEGQEFDHDKMECLMQEENEKIGEGKVAKVLLTGYLLNKKVLRLAKVSVSAGKRKMQKQESEKDLGNEKKTRD